MPPTDTVENFHKEWRELILSKLVKMEADLSQLNHQVTNMRIAQITQKEIDKLEKLCDEQDLRIKSLEGAKTQIYTIFITIQVLIGAAWALILAFKK